MLVLPDADRLRVDLDKLRERVLKSPRDRNGAPHRKIEVGKLLDGNIRGAVNAGAGFADRERPRRFRQFREYFSDEYLGFAARGPVADGDEFDGISINKPVDLTLRLLDAALRFMGIDGDMFDVFSGVVHHGYLTSGPESRIDPEHRFPARRRSDQQRLQVRTKYFKCLLFGPFAQLPADFGFGGGQEQPFETVGNRAAEQIGRGALRMKNKS